MNFEIIYRLQGQSHTIRTIIPEFMLGAFLENRERFAEIQIEGER